MAYNKDADKIKQEFRKLKSKFKRESKQLKAGTATYQDLVNNAEEEDNISVEEPVVEEKI